MAEATRAGTTPTSLLDPRVLNKIGRLGLRARRVVEGFLAGLHRSPYKGVSVEFAEHREYVPGDDLRSLDWRVFGRSDRFVVKQYEEETNLTAHLVMDTSESMAFASGEVSKFAYAQTVVASLAYLVLRQRDAAGIALFDEGVSRILPPATGQGHLDLCLRALEQAVPSKRTSAAKSLRELSGALRRRGIVVVVSDLFDAVEPVLEGLRSLSQRGHEVVVFHTLDPHEIAFPYERTTLFEGLEDPARLLVDPRALREAYLRVFGEFADALRGGCLRNGMDYVRLSTDTPLDVALVAYLGRRARRARGRRR